MNRPSGNLQDAIVKVGDGRGFVVEHDGDRLVITAAHCLPFIPPCMSFSNLEKLTYQELIGPLDGKSTVWAQCLFADPIADIAVLGAPDGLELWEKFNAYQTLLGRAAALPMGAADNQPAAWLMSLDNSWHGCTAHHRGGALWLASATAGIVSGMSGSPIVGGTGQFAIGVVVCSGGVLDEPHTSGGPNPYLTRHLPAWLAPQSPAR
jgi:hypothetical protein